MRLQRAVLNEEGKRIVSEDPDLGPETMSKLLALQPPTKSYAWNFNSGLDDEGSDIGFAGLSLCINDNLAQPMGELVARYAEMRHIPYTAVAVKLFQLYRENGGKFQRFYHNGNIYDTADWVPVVVKATVLPPPKAKRNALGSGVA